MMLSYAQNGEDVVLQRVFSDVPHGYYIDVGAADPTENSVTRHFYDHGWTGINIEPQPQYHARLANDRPRDINLLLGVSDVQSTLSFFQCPKIPEWSTFSTRVVNDLKATQNMQFIEQKVPVRTLQSICDQYVRGPIQFLKIDAEEHEKQVILGNDWKRFRPIVVVIEASAWQTWDQLVLDQGYLFCMEDGINRYYLRKEDEALAPRLAYPAAVRDNYVLHRHLMVWDRKREKVQEVIREVAAKPVRLLEKLPIVRRLFRKAS